MESPAYKKQKVQPLSFPQAMERMVEGKKVRKLDWPEDCFGYFNADGELTIYRDKAVYRWLLSKNDVIGEGWIEVENKTN